MNNIDKYELLIFKRYELALEEVKDKKRLNRRTLNKKEFNQIKNKYFYRTEKEYINRLRYIALSEIDDIDDFIDTFSASTYPRSEKEQNLLDRSFKLLIYKEGHIDNTLNRVELYLYMLKYKQNLARLIEFGKEHEVYKFYLKEAEKIYNDKSMIFNKPFCAKNLDEIREIKQKYSFSEELEIDYSKIKDIYADNLDFLDLKDANLTIDLRKFDTARNPNHKFINLFYTNLKGNKVIGDLYPIKEYNMKYYYNENTFDDNYKTEHPEFFLSSEAPDELKEIYYRHGELDFETYLKYYKYLKNKYLGNFSIKEDDNIKIRLLHIFGINNVKIIITSLCEMNMPINYVLEIINKMSDNEIKYYFSSSCDDMTKNNEEFLNDFIEKLRKVNR